MKITNIKQLKNIKNIGEHTLSVVEDILNYSFSKEVEAITSQDYYPTVKVFNSIFGCGPVASNKLYDLGVRTVEALREHFDSIIKNIHADHERLRYGLTYQQDLADKPVTKDECHFIFNLLKRIIQDKICSECIVELTGGFRR